MIHNVSSNKFGKKQQVELADSIESINAGKRNFKEKTKKLDRFF